MKSTANMDRAATAFSLACIAHCLALPVLALVLPVAGVLAEVELVHWTLGALAIAASVSVPILSADARRPDFLIPAVLGATLVAAAFFAEHFRFDETTPTVLGGLLLSAAHLRRLWARG